MGSADLRSERNALDSPFERLRYDHEGYFRRGVRAGHPAHTNEHIQADCVEAILKLREDVDRIARALGRLEPSSAGVDLGARIDRLEAQLKKWVIDNA